MEKHRHPFDMGPFLTAAALCERVLTEQDGVNSLIRIVDRLTITAGGSEAPENMPPSQHLLSLYISFKSGTARGVKQLMVRIQKPDGNSPQPLSVPLNFEGEDDRGTNLIMQIQFEIDVVGLWWLDVSLDDNHVTKLPLRVIYLRQPSLQGPTLGGPLP